MLNLNVQTTNYSIQLENQTLRIQGSSGDDNIRIERGRESTDPRKVPHDLLTDYIFVSINDDLHLPIHLGHSNSQMGSLQEVQIDGGDGHDTIEIDVSAIAGKQAVYEPNIVVFDNPDTNTIEIEGGNSVVIHGEPLVPEEVISPEFHNFFPF